MRNKYLRNRTFILMYLWFYNIFVFYGFIFSASSLGFSLNVVITTLGIAELIACLISGILFII